MQDVYCIKKYIFSDVHIYLIVKDIVNNKLRLLLILIINLKQRPWLLNKYNYIYIYKSKFFYM